MFQKIWDEVKYLCRVVTAGSKEAKHLEQVKKAFEEAYQESEVQKNTAQEGGNIKYSISYRDAIDKLAEGTLDRTTNTHLLVLENTPQVYIDKAGAKNQKIIMGWDIAYLAMNKNGDIPGNYHGLGKDVMKNLPEALKDPLFIVKQNNGRVAAVTEVVVKKNRSVVVSIEFDAFKSTVQDGEAASENYNIIVTAMDAKPNYLQNTILSGNIVYNKNNENPANFILRLKSLNKALPNDDLARFSKTSIRNSEPDVKHSLSDSSEDIGPVRGDIYGSDVAVEEAGEIGPMASNATVNTSNATANESIGPMREDVSKTETTALPDGTPIRDDIPKTEATGLPEDTPIRDDIDLLSEEDMDAEEPPAIRTVRERLTEKLYSSREELASNEKKRFYVQDVVAIKKEAPLITGTHNMGGTGGANSTISRISRILDVKRSPVSVKNFFQIQLRIATRYGEIFTAQMLRWRTPGRSGRWHVLGKKRAKPKLISLCSRYLSSRVGQVLSYRRKCPLDIYRQRTQSSQFK